MKVIKTTVSIPRVVIGRNCAQHMQFLWYSWEGLSKGNNRQARSQSDSILRAPGKNEKPVLPSFIVCSER